MPFLFPSRGGRPAPGRHGAGRRTLLAWALYDWATSPFAAIVVTFVFPAYFTRAIATDELSGTAQWGWAMTASALAVAFLSPPLGAVADAGGRRKPWLVNFTVLGALATAGLWWAMPSPTAVLATLVLVAVANAAIEIAGVFYNAMLPDLAPPERLGRWSGWAWSLGYAGGLTALLLLLGVFVQAETPPFGLDEASAEHVRIAGPLVAVWLLVFTLPLVLLVPDRPATPLGPIAAVVHGLARLRGGLALLRGDRPLALFLVARLVYNDGLNTLFSFGGIYAAGTFGMAIDEVILFGVVLNVTAGVGAWLLAALDDRLGSKPTILIALAGLTVFGALALLATDKATFWAAGTCLGLFVGPTQAASRTLMARLTPPDRRAELFGFYALTGKITAFVGPALLAGATLLFASQRGGMAVILLFFVIGGLLLLLVREPTRPVAPASDEARRFLPETP